MLSYDITGSYFGMFGYTRKKRMKNCFMKIMFSNGKLLNPNC